MAGIQIKLNVSLDGANFPILKEDEIISNGSLLLVDNNYFPPTGLDNGTLLKNIAYQKAANIINPSLLESQLQPYVRRGTLFSGSAGLAEITGKGGIHALISQVNHTDKATQFFTVTVPLQLRQYFTDNAGHNYYLSVWKRRTRVGISGVAFAYSVFNFTNTSNYITFEDAGFSNSSFFGGGTKVTSVNASTLGNVFKNIGPATKVGPTNSTAENGNVIFAIGGGLPAYGDAGLLNKCESSILYRYYVEDLTVSGRTYAEVSALDQALYAEATAPGGRLNTDTFTAAATLP